MFWTGFRCKFADNEPSLLVLCKSEVWVFSLIGLWLLTDMAVPGCTGDSNGYCLNQRMRQISDETLHAVELSSKIANLKLKMG